MVMARCIGIVTFVLTAGSWAAEQQPASNPAARRVEPRAIYTDDRAYTADISIDGQLALVVTQPFGRGTKDAPARIHIRNLATGAVTELAGGPSPAGTPGRPAAVFSPDATQIAYSWLDERLTDTGMLQLLAAAEGAKPRTLIAADPSDIGIVPHGWSPDGKRILVLVHGPSATMAEDPASLAWVSVADGTMETIREFQPWRRLWADHPRLSRDGRWITYSAVARRDSDERHIFVLDAQRRSERAVVTLPGSSRFPVWSADGEYLVFANEEGDTVTLLATRAGKRASNPLLRFPAKAFTEPIALTRSGALYFREPGGAPAAFIAELGGPLARIVGALDGYSPTWITEQRLAFVRFDRELVVRDTITGTERAHRQPFVPMIPPRVLRNGSAAVLYIPSGSRAGRQSGDYHWLDLTTGQGKRLFSTDMPDGARSGVAVLSPDDETLYLGVVAEPPNRWSGIVAVELASLRERHVVKLPQPLAVQGMALSPDGQTFALHLDDGRIVSMTRAGTDYREIVGPSGGSARDQMRWSPDGQSIFFVVRATPASSEWRLMKVAAAGGSPEYVGIDSSLLPSAGPIVSFDLSPGGSRVALGIRPPLTFNVRVVDRYVPGR